MTKFIAFEFLCLYVLAVVLCNSQMFSDVFNLSQFTISEVALFNTLATFTIFLLYVSIRVVYIKKEDFEDENQSKK